MSDIDRQLPRHLRRKRRGTVVVIADRPSEVRRLRIARSPWADAQVVALVGRSAAQMHAELAARSEVGLVIDVRPSPGRRSCARSGRTSCTLTAATCGWRSVRPGRVRSRP